MTGYSLIIHGGAGPLAAVPSALQADYHAAMRHVLESGRELLESGATALEVVTECARLLEDDPLFNAGFGSVLTSAGEVEMDASLMEGRDLRVGAVCGVKRVRNPIQLALRVLERQGPVLLCGHGAELFAEEIGEKLVENRTFITEQRYQQWQKAQQESRVVLDHELTHENEKYGTIGAVAMDLHGNLAAATSTGGVGNKPVGRIGDSPIPGAGVWADNATCAVSSTGFGEDILRFALAHSIASRVELLGETGQAAARVTMENFRRRIAGRAGVIGIDHGGNPFAEFTTEGMFRGWVSSGKPVFTAIFRDEA